jgi:hypothetical protein
MGFNSVQINKINSLRDLIYELRNNIDKLNIIEIKLF